MRDFFFAKVKTILRSNNIKINKWHFINKPLEDGKIVAGKMFPGEPPKTGPLKDEKWNISYEVINELDGKVLFTINSLGNMISGDSTKRGFQIGDAETTFNVPDRMGKEIYELVDRKYMTGKNPSSKKTVDFNNDEDTALSLNAVGIITRSVDAMRRHLKSARSQS